MHKFTPEAEAYVRAALKEMPREWLENELLAICIEPKEDDTNDQLAEALVSSVECGDTEFDIFGIYSSKQFSYKTSQLYLDVEDVYQS